MEPRAPNTIVVVGVGTATVTPDIADFSIGLQATGRAPGTALAEVTAAAEAVLATARGRGLSDADLRTHGVSVYARTDPHLGEITAYQAAYTLRLRVSPVSTAPEVIDALAQVAGDALRLGGLNLTPADSAEARARAAANAVADARSRAEQLAQAAGVRLGPVISIVEGSPPVFHQWYGAPMGSYGDVVRAAAAPVQPGSDEIIAHVGVTFGITEHSV